jgi:hypothetical protein
LTATVRVLILLIAIMRPSTLLAAALTTVALVVLARLLTAALPIFVPLADTTLLLATLVAALLLVVLAVHFLPLEAGNIPHAFNISRWPSFPICLICQIFEPYSPNAPHKEKSPGCFTGAWRCPPWGMGARTSFSKPHKNPAVTVNQSWARSHYPQ